MTQNPSSQNPSSQNPSSQNPPSELPRLPGEFVEAFEAPEIIRPMMFACGALLWSLSDDQRERMTFPMDSPHRLDWDFVPKPDRVGVPLWELDKQQRTMAQTLLASGLSTRGYGQALQIMAMENILRELQVGLLGVGAGELRNPDAYYFSVYGRPAHEDTWGWRILGHHLSLSYTIVGQRYISVTPCNMGAQPAESGTISPLRQDEQLAFTLLNSLAETHRVQAVIHHRAPADFVTRQVPHVGAVEYPDYYDLGILDYSLNDADREALKFVRDEPAGLAADELDEAQTATLLGVVDCFLDRLPQPIADRHRDRLERRGLENLFFAWAGGDRPGTPHYYRIHGWDMLIEFDNAVGGANHIHSNWRDLDNDLGHDLLLDHYARERETGHHLTTRLQSSVPYERPAR